MMRSKKISCMLILTLIVNLLSGLSGLSVPAYAAGLEASKVLDLKFEDNITDSSVNAITGILNGGAPSYIAGQSGKGIMLNGTDNSIDLGTSAALQPQNLTFTAWVYNPGTWGTKEEMITWFKPSGAWNGNGWYLSCLSDAVPLKLSTGTGVQESYVNGNRSTFFPVGQWTHIAVTYDSVTRNVSIYRNGIPQTVSYNMKAGSIVSTADHKYIGDNSPGYAGGFANIGLDELKIYSAAATEGEIQALYAAEGGNIDETAAQGDLDAITVPASTIGNITLPTLGNNGSTITWVSDTPSVLSNTGVVTPPQTNTTVKLTATVTHGTVTKTKDFNVLVTADVNVEILKQFDMEQVNVTDPYYLNAFNKDVSYINSLEPDRLLAGFREVAGLSKKADVYGGWENTMIKGHTLGHYMSAIAQAYKETKDDSDLTLNTQLKTKIDYIMDELEACQNASSSGYLFATPETHFDIIEGTATGPTWVPWYTMHKIIAGLVDVYKYEGNPKALSIANKLGDWVYNRSSKWSTSTQARVLNVEYGGMNDCLYELYKLTKNANHLTAAHKFDQDALFTPMVNGTDNLANVHANTTIPKLIGAVNRYRTLGTGESFYLTAARQFWNMVIRDHTYVTGGNSENEHFRTAGLLDAYRNNINDETCNVYNMLKLSRELFKITGDVKYADYYEKTYINEIMSSENPETGMTTYFKAMGTGYFKVFGTPTGDFWCCTGSGMENFTKLDDSIYYHTDNDLYVNMYLSSTLNWTEKGLRLTQEASLPDSDKVTFTIDAAPASAVNIKFRSPSWIANGQKVTVAVNGQVLDTAAVNGYIDVNRVWNQNDKVELTLPMEVQVSRLADNKNAVAFTYGPVVLSAGLGTENMATVPHGIGVRKASIPSGITIKDYIIIKADTIDAWLSNISNNLVKTAGKVEFTLRNTDEDNNLKFTPQYQRYTDRYGIYFNLIEKDSALFQQYVLNKKEADKIVEATIDKVQVTNDQHELAHNLQGNSSGGSYGGYMYRQANTSLSATDGAGWFSYDMTIDPSTKNYLSLKYYSGDAGRTFNIYIDGNLLKEETIQAKATTGFYDVRYEIPAAWLTGKTKVTVKFANRGASIVGGIYGDVCIMKDYDTNPNLQSVTVNGQEAALTNGIFVISVPEGSTEAAVKFTPENKNALVYVNNILIDDTLERTVALGANTTTRLYIRVVAEDGVTEKAYAVSIHNIQQGADVPVTNITLDRGILSLVVKESEQINAAISPSNASITDVIWTSSDNDVATVDFNGNITAVAQGTATITATTLVGNYTAVCTVNVNPQADTSMLIWYKLNETSGTAARDLSGHNLNGVVNGGATWLGREGISLDGSNDYIQMPNGVLAGVTDITVSTDVFVDSSNIDPSWIFTFGSSTDPLHTSGAKYLGLLHDGSHKFRCAISNDRWTNELNTNKGSALAKGVWKHIVYTLSGTTGTLYEDGVQVAQNTGVTLDPKDIEATIANYIGKPAYLADKYFKGKIKNFRVYNRALSLSEIQAQAAVQVSGVTLDKGTAALKVGETDTLVATIAPADAANKAVVWSSSNEQTATVSSTGVVTAVAAGTATITATTADGGFIAACNVTVTASAAAKPFILTSGGSLDRSSGVRASVKVNLTQGATTHDGPEAVVFQLMRGNTPVSIVALERDIISQEDLTACFNVDPSDTSYVVRVYVLDSFSSDMTAPISLAEQVTLN